MSSSREQSSGYNRPPITEAVIEFRFAQPMSLETIDKARSLFSKNFPVVTQLNQVNLNIEEPELHLSGYVNGYRMDNSDSTNIIMLTLGLVAFSRLAPYDGWNAFSVSALEVLQDLRKEVGFFKISRIGVRYVNRIDIPAPKETSLIRLEDYITIRPEYPENGLPPLRGFTVQTTFLLTDTNTSATITTASVSSPVPWHMGIILDTDIGRTVDVPQNPREIRELLDMIRAEKNRVFEACITDKTRELFA